MHGRHEHANDLVPVRLRLEWKPQRNAREVVQLPHRVVSEEWVARRGNNESVRALVTSKAEGTRGKISAKRLLPEAVFSGYSGSARNFRRLVAQEKTRYRQRRASISPRRPAVWSPGEHLVIEWGVQDGLHVFCAVLAFSRVRFVRFADNERAETTLAMLAASFQVLGGVPKVVLADRMGCLRGGSCPDPNYVFRASTSRVTRPRVKDPG